MTSSRILSLLSDDPQMVALLDKRGGKEIAALSELLRGEPGKKLVKGKDYFTKEEIEAFKKAVTPVKGKDYYTDGEIISVMQRVYEAVCEWITEDLKKELAPVKGRDYFDGIDGEDAEEVDIEALARAVSSKIEKPKDADTTEIIEAVQKMYEGKILTVEDIVKEIKEGKLLELRDIKGARLDTPSKKANDNFNMNDQRWHGAGGTTSSGANVTTQYLLTAVQVGDDVTIDLTQLAQWATFDQVLTVYRNNIPQTEGASYNFTITGSVLTIYNADAGDVFNLTYSYV